MWQRATSNMQHVSTKWIYVCVEDVNTHSDTYINIKALSYLACKCVNDNTMMGMTEMTVYDFVKKRTTCAKKLLSEGVQELLLAVPNYVSARKMCWRMRCTITGSD